MKKIVLILLLACVFVYCPESYGKEKTLDYDTNYRIVFGFGNNYDLNKFSKFAHTTIATALPTGYTMFESKGVWNHPEKGVIRENNLIILYDVLDTPERQEIVANIAKKFTEIFRGSGASAYIVKTPILEAKSYL